jgi:IclR family pca regulon transcriptional regulator
MAEPAAERGSSRRDYRVDALAKGLRVLSVFSEQRPTMRLKEIAEAADVLMPTAYRLVMTLVSEGYVEQLPDGAYRPAAKVLTLGTAALRSLDLVDVATTHLQRLHETTGETVNLAVLTDDKVLYLVRLRNADLVTANLQVGSTLPAVYTSMGKLLLSELADEELNARVTSRSFVTGRGPRAAKDLESLKPELTRIRKAGYAIQDEEVAFGLRSIAAPVRDGTGNVIAGVNIAVNSMEWQVDRMLDDLKPPLLAACADMSKNLGYRG